MPTATSSLQRLKSRKLHHKTVQQESTQTSRCLVPGVDYPIFLPDDPSVERPGVAWAEKHGYAHIRRVSEEDALLILDKLQVDDELITNVFAALTKGNPWYWLEQFEKAGGDLGQLHIK